MVRYILFEEILVFEIWKNKICLTVFCLHKRDQWDQWDQGRGTPWGYFLRTPKAASIRPELFFQTSFSNILNTLNIEQEYFVWKSIKFYFYSKRNTTMCKPAFNIDKKVWHDSAQAVDWPALGTIMRQIWGQNFSEVIYNLLSR